MGSAHSATNRLVRYLADEDATVEFGRRLAAAAGSLTLTIYLHGELGAGKTTLCRGIIGYFGHSGAVKSPTYTLVEPYELAEKSIFHFDLYRMAAPDELSYLGLEEYFDRDNRLGLVEWPERGEGALPPPDLSLTLRYAQKAVSSGAEPGREIELLACSDAGQTCLENLQAAISAAEK